MKNRLVENMTRYQHGPYSIRIWSSALNEEDAEDFDGSALYAVFKSLEEQAGRADIAKAFADIEGVEAVEVLSKFGNGVLIYPDWK